MNYRQSHVVVRGSGPAPCDWLWLGEAPGVEEIRCDPPTPFVGKSGLELGRFLDGEFLPDRQSIFLTNVCKHFPEKKNPTAEEIRYWAGTLRREIRTVDPTVIVTLGAVATRAILGPDISIEKLHGLPHRVEVEGKPRWVIPTYHPAAALHNPEVQSLFAYDMDCVATGWRKGWRAHKRDRVSTSYRPMPLGCPIPREFSIDTEGWPDDPYCLTISWIPGVALIVYAWEIEKLKQIAKAVRRARRVTCQGMLADLDVLDAMGIRVPDAAIDDTQIMLYNLGMEPLSLKTAAFRHLGAEQEEYDEVTAKAEEQAHIDHITNILDTHDNERVVKACIRVLLKAGKPDRKGEIIPVRQLWKNSKFSQVCDPVPRTTLHDVRPHSRVVRYACRDADLTERLRRPLRAMIKDRGLDQVYRNDLNVIPIVNRMQHVGMRVDREHFQRFCIDMDQRFLRNNTAIQKVAGFDLNPNSGDQVSKYLFDTLRLKGQKKTKSKKRYSSQDKFLEALRFKHAIVPLIIEGREITKLKSAYGAAILKAATEDEHGLWFLFPHLRITRVISGRVSAFDPNVLAIPKHSALGKAIRKGFLAGDGNVLLSTDLSQIELRVAAHECQDPAMMKVFEDGGDLHASLGYDIFGVKPEDQDDSIHRLPMKKANFGYWMGISASGMRDQVHAATGGIADPKIREKLLNMGEDAFQAIIDRMEQAWPKAREYKQAKIAQARKLGYVTDFCGRRRYLAGVNSTDERVRAEAERQAHATPIQAGAQEVFKTWMSRIHTGVIERERKKGTRGTRARYLEPWLQVHDDFICETDRRIQPRVQERIQQLIPQMLRVPVAAKSTHAENWGAL